MGNMDSRVIEHQQSQGNGLARQSTRAKTSSRPVSLHPNMRDRVTTTVGTPPTGAPLDASSPSPLDPTRTKAYPVPGVTRGMEANRGNYNPSLAYRVMSEAVSTPDDFAKHLHTKLPEETSDD